MPVGAGDPDAANILDVLGVAGAVQRADPAHHEHLLTGAKDIAAPVGIVVLKGGEHLTQSHFLLEQQFGLDDHLILLDPATKGVDIADTSNLAYGRFDHPILQGADFLELLAGRAFNDVAEDFARAGGHGLKLPRRPGGKAHTLHLFKNLRPGVFVAGGIVKGAGDDGQAEHADGAQTAQTGGAVEGLLRRPGDQRLNVLGGLPGPEGNDLGMDIIRIGKGLDRNLGVRVIPVGDEDENKAQQGQAVIEGEIDELLDHGGNLAARADPTS